MKPFEVMCGKWTLTALSRRYCEGVWKAWHQKKNEALQDPNNPMLGGPGDAMSHGFASLTKPDGSEITLGKLTRVRLRDLSMTSLKILSTTFGKDLVAMSSDPKKAGMDVFHQEFVDTFDENVANDEKHLLNNLLMVAAMLDTVATYILTEDMSMDVFLGLIGDVLKDDASVHRFTDLISSTTRASWIGRAVVDGSWKVSADFNWYTLISKKAKEIDPYVCIPTLKALATDLAEGRL